MTGAFKGAQGLTEEQESRPCRIAVIVNHQEDPWDQTLVRQVKKIISSSEKFQQKPQFEVYSPNNNPRVMKADVAWKLTQRQEEVDAVITSGPWISVAMMATQRHWRTNVPLVFVGVDDPTGWGLTDNDTFSGSHTTGVRSIPPALHRQVKAMKDLRPNARRVVIFYNRDLSSEKRQSLSDAHGGARSRIVEIMKHDGWKIDMVGLSYNTNVEEEAYYEILKADVAVMLNESTVMMHQDELNRLCKRAKTTLVGLNLLSVIRGAAFGVGSSGSDYAPHVVEQLYKVLIEKLDPAGVDILKVKESDQVWYNPLAIEEQGVRLNENDKRLSQMNSVLAQGVLQGKKRS